MLYQISRNIEDAVISVTDNDGDVLLIEAAMDLPSWIDPSNSSNRVFIKQGNVHIIPLPSSPADIIQIPGGNKLEKKKAIEVVRQSSVNTVADDAVQQTIQSRIEEYPKAAQQEIHRARCKLPKRAAYVLLKEPQLLALAVEAFYLRDPIALKACAFMNTFPPAASAETTIRFTKTTYAQTVSQKFYPPKPFRLPPPSQKREFRVAELGMKLACGMEMLYTDNSGSHSSPVSSSSIAAKDNTTKAFSYEGNSKYKHFIEKLTRLGYFRNERPGSKLYRELEEQAKQQFAEQQERSQTQQQIIPTTSDDVDADDQDLFVHSSVLNGIAPKQKIDELLADYSDEKLQELLSKHQEPEDSDDWMNVDPRQLEEMLIQRMGLARDKMIADMQEELFDASDNDDDDAEPKVDLETMMNKFEKFLEQSKSGIEGVDFPGKEESSEEEEDSEEEDEYEDEDRAVSFDTDRFMAILNEALGVPSARTQEVPAKSETAVSKQVKDTQPQAEENEEDLARVMEEMDREVHGHDKLNASFEKTTVDEEDENAPVDIQLNLVKNVLESYKSQQGLPGPVGNILGQFGMILPADKDEEENSL